ncbi:anti-sigma factor family protein [Mongoliimonas terrestris]|uniref:anti-sigma factor family protein n=1 Tax=Mongoliimonas terrestris TaxID=1709001 RepID=UPI0009496126|nr:zf-HC2 domain-containing protein [Mongoliimonas terrestris]
MTRADGITDIDLHAYVDDQLDPARRIEVENHLAAHPQIAAAVMADLAVRDALRLPADDLPPPTLRLVEQARVLERGLASRRSFLPLARIAAAAFLVAGGWFAHASFGFTGVRESVAATVPPVVDGALAALKTAKTRAEVPSQPKSAVYDPAELRRATSLALPSLPQNWRVSDVQIFPYAGGFSVELMAEADDAGRVSLFAARSPSFDVVAPTALALEDGDSVFWQVGQDVFVLSGETEPARLRLAAERLAGSLY